MMISVKGIVPFASFRRLKPQIFSPAETPASTLHSPNTVSFNKARRVCRQDPRHDDRLQLTRSGSDLNYDFWVFPNSSQPDILSTPSMSCVGKPAYSCLGNRLLNDGLLPENGLMKNYTKKTQCTLTKDNHSPSKICVCSKFWNNLLAPPRVSWPA